MDGWTELQHARWHEAAEAFRDALATEETAAAHEGLSWAAWWLDDGDTLFAARERAFTLYRDGGDRQGAARMALWLAVDELDFRSSWAVASGWLQRAERLLEDVEPGPEHGWLAFHEGYIAHASGDTERARELALRASELGHRLGVPDLEMLGLALEGATLVACARVDEGMRRLDEATATALEGGAANPMSGAWTFCFLVSACTAVLDYGRAAQWCDRIAEFAERYGSRMMLAYCRAEYGAVHLWRGRWTVAEAMLEAAIEDFMRSRPGMVGGPLAGLAELRRRQGRSAEAEQLCERAEGSSSGQLCLARMALDRGDAQGRCRARRAAGRARAGALAEAAAACEALAAEETAAAHEGLSWAAWWLDDGDTVFAARERAYTLYRDGGDAQGAARMALWLAVDELDFRSSWAVASGWLQRAERLLEGIEPGPEHGWLAFHEGYIAHASGDTARAGELARTATELGRRLRRARPRDARARARGRDAGGVRPRRRGHAPARRGDRDGARGRGREPDVGRLDLLLPRLRLHRGARLRARRRSGATGSPSSPSATGAA